MIDVKFATLGGRVVSLPCQLSLASTTNLTGPSPSGPTSTTSTGPDPGALVGAAAVAMFDTTNQQFFDLPFLFTWCTFGESYRPGHRHRPGRRVDLSSSACAMAASRDQVWNGSDRCVLCRACCLLYFARFCPHGEHDRKRRSQNLRWRGSAMR